MISEVYNEDCMIGMSRYPDNFFDLAIVDPPYGMKSSSTSPGDKISKLGIERSWSKDSKFKNWNSLVPEENYWNELLRVSKNQIIWGENYYPKYFGKGRLVWVKHNHVFSGAELAYQSFTEGTYVFDYIWDGMRQQNMKNKEVRIHPTQKPIDLYKWILEKYAKSNDKILDTHLGSGSSRIAAHDFGIDFYGWELDKDYFDSMQKRFEKHRSQQTLFEPKVYSQGLQQDLLTY